MARPSIYETRAKPKLKFIRSLIRAGHSQKEIAEFLDINEDTIYDWKKKYKEFSECFEKSDIIDDIENTFINRLLGRYKATRKVYETNAEGELKLKRVERYEIPFNDGAYIRYLTTVRPDKWKIKEDEEEAVNEIKVRFVDGSKSD